MCEMQNNLSIGLCETKSWGVTFYVEGLRANTSRRVDLCKDCQSALTSHTFGRIFHVTNISKKY